MSRNTPARQAQADVDGKAAIEMGIVDQSLPSHRRARLFEVGAHHDQQLVAQLLAQALKFLRVFDGRFGIVDGAGPHHHHEAVALTMQHFGDILTRLCNALGSGVLQGNLFGQDGWRDERTETLDM